MPGPRGPMGGGRTVEKPANFGNVMGKLVHYCRNYLPVIIIALVLGAAGTICQIIGPDKLKDMTNEIVKGLPAVVNGKPVMNSVDFTPSAHRLAARRTVRRLRGAQLRAKLDDGERHPAHRPAPARIDLGQNQQAAAQILRQGQLRRRTLPHHHDVDAIGQTLGQSLGSLITSATLFVGALVMMFYNNVIMTLCAIGASILGLIIMMVIMKSSQKYFARQQMALGDVNGHIEEMYAGHLIVKAYNGEADSIRRFEKYNADLYESGWKSQFLSGLMMPLMNFVGNFGYVIVCVVGAALAMDGQIEFGVIVAFMMYIRLFTQPLSQFAQAFQNLQRCAAAAERVFGFLEEPEMDAEPTKAELGVADAAASTARTDSGKLSHRGTRANATAGMTASQRSQLLGYDAAGNPRAVRGDVEFSHVRFGYEPGKPIIHDFSASVSAGQKVAIVGPTGAGKTTMVNLLMRFYEISGGSISIDGIDTTSVPRWNVHDQFSMVLQDTWVFRGTVRENIAYSSPASPTSRSSPHARPSDSTTSCALCRGATTPCSTTTPRSPKDSASCSPSPAPWCRTLRSSSLTKPPPPSTPAPKNSSKRPWMR